tara:strand:- start:333 stop:557 length:225 start_codon:yes stop_codon:yes gene_type:complete
MSSISSFISDIIDKIIIEIKKDKNMSKLESNLIDPLIKYTFQKLYPYLALASIIFLLIFILAILILLLQVKQLN